MYRIPMAIYKDEGNPNYGGVIPDVPGCYPCGESIEALIDDARAMIVGYMEYITDEKIAFDLKITDIEILRKNPDYADAMWAFIDIEETAISTKQKRFNVSWPEYLLVRVDAAAEARHETRSGFLAKAVVSRINELEVQ